MGKLLVSAAIGQGRMLKWDTYERDWKKLRAWQPLAHYIKMESFLRAIN